MKINIFRKWENKDCIRGELFVDGQHECFTLEPSRLTPYHEGHPCIPVGIYKVILTPSPHLGYVTPELLDVPGRTAIRIHVGNFPKDVLGCTAVGQGNKFNMVTESKTAFEALMTLLKTAEGDIMAEYTDPK